MRTPSRSLVLAVIAVVACLAALPASATAAALLQTSESAPATADAGADVTYTVTVLDEPSADSAATGVSATASVPAGTTFVSWKQSSGPAFDLSNTSTAATAGGGTLPPGASGVFALTVHVPPGSSAPAAVTSSASASASGSVTSNTATATATVTRHADLVASLSPTATTVAPGANATYALRVHNDGPSDAHAVTVSDRVPDGMTYVSATPAGGWTVAPPTAANGQTVTFTKTADMAAGSSATLTLALKSGASLPDPTLIDDTATVDSATADPDGSDDSASATVGVGTLADLAVKVTASPSPVSPAGTLTYTITLTNAGVDARDVALANPVPSGTTLVSAAQTAGAQAFDVAAPPPGAGGNLTFSLARLVAGGSATFKVVVAVGNAAAGSNVQDTATASTSTSQTRTDNDEATVNTPIVTPPPSPPGTVVDLHVTGKAAAGTARVGRTLRIRFRVVNRGNRAATRTRLTARLPSALRFVSALSNGAECGRGPSLSCDLGTLVPRRGATVTLVVRVRRTGRFTVQARAHSVRRDRRAADNSVRVRLRGRPS